MKQAGRRLILTGLAIVLAVAASSLLHADALRDLQNQVATVLAHPALRSAFVGFEARSLSRGDCLMTVNAEKAFLPASNMKLVTVATALELLGPEHRFRTQLVAAQAPNDGIVHGDLTLVATADPTAQAVLASLLVQLRKKGIARIEGDIVAAGTTAGQTCCASAATLHCLLDQAGISVSGSSRAGAAPHGSVVLAEHTSPQLREIVKSILKPSDNELAERLLLSLRWASGRRQLEPLELIGETWGERGLYLRPLRLVDGSGLSRRNLLTPRFVVRLLRYMHDESAWAAALAHALPIAGVDGTLAERMKGTSAQGRVRAKTGTLTGVSSLSGYAQAKGNETLAFSIMMNNFTCSVSRVRRMQDQICVALVELDRSKDVCP